MGKRVFAILLAIAKGERDRTPKSITEVRRIGANAAGIEWRGTLRNRIYLSGGDL